MTLPIADFARAASAAVRDWVTYDAVETIRAQGIEVTARVRAFSGDRIAVSYTTYQSTLSEMDDLLGGQAEFVREDLEGATLTYDGRSTLYVSPTATFALRTPGRRLYEPIPGFNALAELRCLDDLARDYLLRDGGIGTSDARATRVVGLKPKRSHTASLFRIASFPVERAEVAFDEETLFPLRIGFLPSRDAPFAAIPAKDPWVTVEYGDIRRAADGESGPLPEAPAGARLFEERYVNVEDAAQLGPISLPLATLRELGLEPADGMARVTLDEPSERGHVALVLVQEDEQGHAEGTISLWMGNYVSRRMARRRILAGERGEAVDLGGSTARFFDRRSLWGDHPDASRLPDIADIAWDRDGLFYVLTAEGLQRERLLAVAAALH